MSNTVNRNPQVGISSTSLTGTTLNFNLNGHDGSFLSVGISYLIVYKSPSNSFALY
jgi:hypothetical protein